MEPRSLTYAEREAMIDAGCDPVYCDEFRNEKATVIDRKTTKWIVENVIKDEALPDRKARLLARAIWDITTKDDEEDEKNSQRSGDGTENKPSSESAENA